MYSEDEIKISIDPDANRMQKNFVIYRLNKTKILNSSFSVAKTF